jgi:CoA-disulfide reductase
VSRKVVIIGGVAGGASAAARLRRLDEKIEIIMFERDEYISFANCGLPYYIGEEIKERNKLLVQTPQAMKARFNIDVRINSEVTSIDNGKKAVKVNSKEKGEYEESYDYLILSPGAKAIRPNIQGINSHRIFTIRNIQDTDKIKEYVDRSETKSAVVIGGGYVGVEMAENLKERGLQVTLVEAAPHILAPFDSDMVVIAEKELADHGVELILGDGVKAFKDSERDIEATLNSGKKVSADLVILAMGVTPDTSLVKGTGIEVGPRGHIVVNDRMETTVKDIYAVGDAVEVVDFITKQHTAIPLAGPANKQGRIAADNIAGLNSTYKGTQGTAVLKVFDLTAASTGNNERTLKRLNIPYKVIYVHPNSHAAYYPGATQMSIKFIFNLEGKILGAQALGYDGVEKRIDVIATVIRLGGTVQDLTELELSYAPPFSSAKDPVNMAGFVAENVLTGRTHTMTFDDLEGYDMNNTILLDVRTEMEFNNGHLEGAVNIPVDSLRERLGELNRNKEIIEYCQVGLRGYIADRILTQNGFRVKNLTGGYKSYSTMDYKPMKKENRSNNGGSHTDLSIDPETQTVKREEKTKDDFDRSLDACGLCCPGPLMQVKLCIDGMKDGQVLKVTASDTGFYADIKAWCKTTNNELVDLDKKGGNITALIQKGCEAAVDSSAVATIKD